MNSMSKGFHSHAKNGFRFIDGVALESFVLEKNLRRSLIEKVSMEKQYKITVTLYNSHPDMLCSLMQTRLELFLDLFFSKK